MLSWNCPRVWCLAAVLAGLSVSVTAQQAPPAVTADAPRIERPFGTLREQAAMQQDVAAQAARHVPARR